MDAHSNPLLFFPYTLYSLLLSYNTLPLLHSNYSLLNSSYLLNLNYLKLLNLNDLKLLNSIKLLQKTLN